MARADLRQGWGGGDSGALPGLTPSRLGHQGWVAWSLNSTSWVSADVWANVKVECEPSWQAFQGHCYRLQAEKRSWQESKKACLRAGGDLLSIHSMAELEFITKQIKQGEGLLVHTPPCPACPAQGVLGPSLRPLPEAKADLSVRPLSPLSHRTAEVEELWIGLNDLKLQMNFEWSDGSLVSFTHWHPFEPNNFRDSLEDCVTIWGPVRTPSPQPPGSALVLGVLSAPVSTPPPHCVSEAPTCLPTPSLPCGEMGRV